MNCVTRVCVLDAELGMEASLTVKEMAGPNVATCQLAAWDENAVKFELKLSNEESKPKTGWGAGGGGGVGDTIEVTWKV